MKIRIKNKQNIKISRSWVKKIVEGTLVLEGVKKVDAEISVLLVNDNGIKELNRMYLNRKGITDVISFRMWEGPFTKIHPEILGDIVVNVQRAKSYSKEFKKELALYIVHGLLHILGYIDDTKKNSKQMQERCDRILSVLKV